MCFHWAPNAVMPSAVVRSSTCAGAICGGEVGCGAWAEAWVANVSGAVASAAQAMSPATLWVRMVSSRWYPPPTRQHDARRLRPSLQREGRRGRVSRGDEGIQGGPGRFVNGPKARTLSVQRTCRWRPYFESYLAVIAAVFLPSQGLSTSGPLSPDSEITSAVNVATMLQN